MNELQRRILELAPDKSTELPPLVAITSPPADAAQREIIGQEVWAAVLYRFEMGLTDLDRVLWKNPPRTDIEKSPEHLRLLHAFDDFVLDQCAEWGWPMLMSVGMIQRIAEWQKHSPHLLERLGKELALRSGVLRGEKKAPLSDGIEDFAESVIPELRMLLFRQKEEFGKRHGVVSCGRIAEWMKLEIKEHLKDFPLLAANVEQLCGFVAHMPHRNGVAARRFEEGDVNPAGFFYQWLAACSNRSAKDVENEISRRRALR